MECLRKKIGKGTSWNFSEALFFDNKSKGDAAHPPSTGKVPHPSSSRSQLRHAGFPTEYPNKETSKGLFYYYYFYFRSQNTCGDILDRALYM